MDNIQLIEFNTAKAMYVQHNSISNKNTDKCSCRYCKTFLNVVNILKNNDNSYKYICHSTNKGI